MLEDMEFLSIFAREIRDVLLEEGGGMGEIEEIRIRINQNIVIYGAGKERVLNKRGFVVEIKHIKETLDYISKYSLYAFADELRQGFITINGGHRIGVLGQAITEKDIIKGQKYISFLNVRIAHEVKGCGDVFLKYLYENRKFLNTLVISAPGCGKTTLLRDIVRSVSNGNYVGGGVNVGIVDERSEIAGCYMGEPQNDVGIRTDVMDGCPKAEGMMLLMRSMSPKVIAVDELGSDKDIEAIKRVINCGAKLIATVHGQDFEEIKSKKVYRELISEKCFDRYIILKSKEDGHVWADVRNNQGVMLNERWR